LLYGHRRCWGCLLYRRDTDTGGLPLRPAKRRSVALQLEVVSRAVNMAQSHMNPKGEWLGRFSATFKLSHYQKGTPLDFRACRVQGWSSLTTILSGVGD
jgi:hypothetical protein